MRLYDKALLLAELFDVDTTRYAQLILREITESGTYVLLMKNIDAAKMYECGYTHDLLKKFDEMHISEIKTVKEALLLKSNLDYFCQISSPRFYINPLLFTPEEIKCPQKVIGELSLVCQNKEMTINQLVETAEIKTKDKILAIGDVVKKWKEEAQNELMIPTQEILIKSRQGVVGKKYSGITLIEGTFLSLIFLSFIYFLFSDLEPLIVLKTTVNFDILGILFLVLIGLVSIFIGQFTIHYFFASKKQRERENAYAYIILSGGRIVRKIDKAAYDLHHYLLDILEKKESALLSLTAFSRLIYYRKCIFFLRKSQKEESLNFKVNDVMIATKISLMILIFFIYVFIISVILMNGGVV